MARINKIIPYELLGKYMDYILLHSVPDKKTGCRNYEAEKLYFTSQIPIEQKSYPTVHISEMGVGIGPHRIMAQIYLGLDNTEQVVCHSCDNKRCCEPQHLFLGNQSLNMKDCVSKGRFHPFSSRWKRNNAQ